MVVQDAFLTETAQFADVVLPAAIWGEKTGTFTNVDRTVHLSDKAVEPPGEARSDLDIWLDYARRMDFRNLDGDPLVQWHDPETAFEAWKRVLARAAPATTRGMTYGKLRGGSGIQWPCTAEAPDGTERLYTDGLFNTDPDYCETYGHDLATGAENSATEYKAKAPKAEPSCTPPSTSHRTRSRTPTTRSPSPPAAPSTIRTPAPGPARTPQLEHAAPSVWVEICPGDADALGLIEGDWFASNPAVAPWTPRSGSATSAPGLVFAPFHYGYFDQPEGDQPATHPSAANELTLTEWDPVSKQPYFKFAAVRVTKLHDTAGHAAPAPTNTGSAPSQATQPRGTPVPEPTTGGAAAESESTTQGS